MAAIDSATFQRQLNEQATLTKLTETSRVVEEIIQNLEPEALNQIFSQCGSDFNQTYDILFDEAYRVLFGTRGVIKEAHLGYMDKLAENMEETLRIESLNYFLVSVFHEFDINFHHLEWGNFLQQYKRLAIVAPRDHGKCFGAGTLIRMADGTLKKAEDVKAGDYVMGVNSIPRRVLATHSGEDEMFHIHQCRAMSYTCNSKHDLHFSRKGLLENKEVRQVVKEKLHIKGNGIFGYRQGFDLQEKKFEIEPYFLGLWLGDGKSKNVSISSIDQEIINYVKDYAESNGMLYTAYGWNQNKGCFEDHNIVTTIGNVKGQKLHRNKIVASLKNYGVWGNKHIPNDFLLGSRKQRLALLAGLIDTDGTLHDGCFYISLTNQKISEGIKKLCDTLGFRCSLKKRDNCMSKTDERISTSWDCCITGDIHEVPTILPRKQKQFAPRRNNYQNSKITIEPAGWGKYYGFSIDGPDKLFLLEDGTVCHNSYYFSNVFPAWKMYRYKPKNAFIANPRPDIYLGEFGSLITNEASLGEELLEILKNSIEGNPILRDRLFPGRGAAQQTSWAMRKIKCRNGARLITKSYGTKFRGRHPGWVVSDDFMDDSALYSKDQREKFVNWHQSVLMNALLKEGQIVVAGTPFHENDLFGVLKKRKGWRVFVYPAITPEGRVLWPSRYSFQDLMDKRDENGPIAFSREQLCKPIVSDASIFPYELVSKAFRGMENYRLVQNRESFPIRFNRVVTAGDFAMSANIGADYTVFMTFGIDADDNRWLLHFWRAKGKTFQEQMLQLRRINTEFRPDVIMLESNQFQQIFVQEADRQNLPVLPHNTNTNKYDMKEGVPGLALTFERNKFRFPRGDKFSQDATDLLASELGSIAYTDKGLQGVGEHDDTVMCLWIADCATRHISTGFKFTTV